MSERNQVNRIAITSMGIGICLFTVISLLSFNVQDWPNPDVSPTMTTYNLCGPVGSFIAYQCEYYLGPASWPILGGLLICLLMFCMNKPLDQPIFRTIGLLLIATALASSRFLINQGDSESLSIGYGGLLGITTGHFLLTKTAMTGAVLIIFASFFVGMLLAMDHILFAGLRFVGNAIPNVKITTGKSKTKAKQPKKQKVTINLNPLTRIQNAIAALVPSGTSRTATMQSEPMDNTVQDDFEDPQEEYEELEDEYEYEYEEDDEVEEEGEDQPIATAKPKAKKVAQKTPQRNTSLKQVSSALAKIKGFAKPTANVAMVKEDYTDYKYPSLDLLCEPQQNYARFQEKIVTEKGKVLSQTLKEFNINANVVEIETGPVITMFELELAPGIKVAQITSLANDLARSLSAPSVRVVAPLPGRHTIGIEVPNSEKEKVRIKELMQSSGDLPSKMRIPLFLGKDASGESLIADLTDMPHCLIAGTTGSGKSVCINSIIMSILLTQRPDMVKLILVDPKMVEMNAFRDLAHLMCPIVTEMKKAEQILEWLTVKMDERYATLAEARVRNISNFNKLTEDEIYERFQPSNEEEKAKVPTKMPYLVVIIDELADLMMTSAKEVESHIIRLAQKSRAVGIHIILATQRPQATVVTGLIKSNLPSRISFRVAARMDSRIVLDQNGAETLLGQGDMLFLKPGTSELMRAQGTFIEDKEITHVVKYLKEVSQPNFHPELVQMNTLTAGPDMERDELFDDAVQIILETRRGSVSLLQRRLTIGYSRASRLIDQMASAGIVGDYKGSQAREVLLTLDEYEQIKRQMALDATMGYQDLMEDEPQSLPVETQISDEVDAESRFDKDMMTPTSDDIIEEDLIEEPPTETSSTHSSENAEQSEVNDYQEIEYIEEDDELDEDEQEHDGTLSNEDIEEEEEELEEEYYDEEDEELLAEDTELEDEDDDEVEYEEIEEDDEGEEDEEDEVEYEYIEVEDDDNEPSKEKSANKS